MGLDAQTTKERRSARAALRENLPAAAPLVWRTRLASQSVEVRESCRDLLADWVAKSGAHWLGLNEQPDAGDPAF